MSGLKVLCWSLIQSPVQLEAEVRHRRLSCNWLCTSCHRDWFLVCTHWTFWRHCPRGEGLEVGSFSFRLLVSSPVGRGVLIWVLIVPLTMCNKRNPILTSHSLHPVLDDLFKGYVLRKWFFSCISCFVLYYFHVTIIIQQIIVIISLYHFIFVWIKLFLENFNISSNLNVYFARYCWYLRPNALKFNSWPQSFFLLLGVMSIPFPCQNCGWCVSRFSGATTHSGAATGIW